MAEYVVLELQSYELQRATAANSDKILSDNKLSDYDPNPNPDTNPIRTRTCTKGGAHVQCAPPLNLHHCTSSNVLEVQWKSALKSTGHFFLIKGAPKPGPQDRVPETRAPAKFYITLWLQFVV